LRGGFVNVTNGNVHIEIPLATNKQRGNLQLDERLVYDSRIWTINAYPSYSWSPTNVANSSAGWRFVSGGETGTGLTQTIYETDPNPCNPYDSGGPEYSYFVWYDNNGTAHMFNAPWTTIIPGNDNDDCSEMDEGPESVTGSAVDSSGYQIELSGDNYYSPSTMVVLDSSGNQVYPNAQDRFGNYWSTDGSGNLVDTLGRTPVETTQSGNVTTYSVLGFGGARHSYTVTTEPIGVSTGFGQSGVSEWSGTLNPVYSIGLPDGSSYTFTYDGYGEMTSMTLPTGGVVNFGYSNYQDSYQNENRWITSYSGGHGNLTFTPSVLTRCSGPSDVGCQEQMKVTDDYGNDNLYTLTLNNGAWNTEVAYYNGSVGAGHKLVDNTAAYDFSGTCPYSYCTGAAYITEQSNTTSLTDVGYATQATYVINSLTGQMESQKQWDYFSGSPSESPLTDTEYAYDYTSLPDNLTGVQVLDSSGNQVSQTIYNYVPSATPTSGIVNHSVPSDTYLLNPYLGSVQQWISTTGGTSNYLTASFTNDDTGAQLTTTDPNGQTTFGREATDSYVTTVTPPTPSSGVSLPQSAAYDPSTGLVASMTDPNGETTTYSYDWAGRLVAVNYPDGGSESVNYTPNQTGDFRAMNASESAQTQTLYDSYGRLSRVAVYNGQGTNPWYQTDYCYDDDGRLYFKSYQYQGTGWGTPQVCSGAGDTYAYDSLGRLIQIFHGDGTAITYAYTGRATQVTDENGVSRISQVDGLGRTTAVCEISSNSSMPGSGSPVNCGLDRSGTGFLTTYTYSLAGHTTTVNQGGQTRTFQTDGVGRTVSVAEPESGTTNYSYAYNGTGLVVTRTKPQANQTNSGVLTTTTTQYDAVGRPVSVSYNDGVTPEKGFYYDQATIWGTGGNPSTGAAKGRLTESATNADSEAFVYDATGRVLDTLQCIPGWCGNAAYDKWTPYAYDWMGNITSADDGSGTVSTYTYSPAGEVTSITSSLNDSTHPPNLVSNVVNGPDGPTSWQLGNGLDVVRTYDSLGRLDGGWVCNGSSDPYCTGGTQDYGFSLSSLGSRIPNFCDTALNYCAGLGYDEFNRLTNMTHDSTVYTYSYDRWGNRWQQNALSGGSSFNVSFNTANNQINTSGFSYDAAGNLMSDGLHTYSYDAEGNLMQVDGGSTATYQYSALNQRVRADEGGNSIGFIYNQGGQWSSLWDLGGWLLQGGTYWDNNAPVEFYAGGTAHFQHQDWQGVVRVQTSYNGSIEATFNSLPFGDGTATPTGMYKDSYGSSDSGTDHAQFRQYYNWQGRWMSPDPYSGSYDFSSPQSLNRYSYVMNNPLTFTDPSGQMTGLGGYIGTSICGPPCGLIALGIDGLIGWAISDLFGGHPSFHGSLQPRPSTPSDPASFGENLGLPSGMPQGNWGLGLALNLPSEGCEFGACGGGLGFEDQQGQTAPSSLPNFGYILPPWLASRRYEQRKSPGRETPRNIPSEEPGPEPNLGPFNEPPATNSGRFWYTIMQLLRVIGNNIDNPPAVPLIVNPCAIDPIQPYCHKPYNGPA
jgi:RHS repeat-associated protein